MDPLQTLRQRVSISGLHARCPGIMAVLAHIEQAETFFRKANEEHESQYFNDAVYRANHAFEGILREAYALFTEKDSACTSIYYEENALL
jgi:hypothetical protein